MVYVYAAQISNLTDPKDNSQVLDGFPDKRKEKILRYRQAKDRIQSLGASLLLNAVLKEHGFSIEQISFGKNGKPEISGIFFNLSHSDEMVVCAVSDKAVVGCDVEKICQAPFKIARRYFCKSEIEYLDRFEGEAKNVEFYRVWTLKESYMKMTGEGMGLGLDTVRFVFEESVKVLRNDRICNCSVQEYNLSGYKVSVCAEETEFTQDIIWLLE